VRLRCRCLRQTSITSHEIRHRPPLCRPGKSRAPPYGVCAAFEPVQDGRIYIEKINGPFLFNDKATPAEYSAALKLAIERGWLVLHESGTFVKLTQSGADLFA
jgi:hypothetical protein